MKIFIGESYKSRRKLLTSAFHFNMLKRYVSVINDQSDKFIKNLGNNKEEFTADVIPLFADLSLNIISGKFK